MLPFLIGVVTITTPIGWPTAPVVIGHGPGSVLYYPYVRIRLCVIRSSVLRVLKFVRAAGKPLKTSPMLRDTLIGGGRSMESVTHWKNFLALHVADSTAEAYVYEVQRLAAYFGRDPSVLDFNDLTEYLADRKASGLGQAALYRATNALRSFYKFHYGDESPAKRLPLKKPPIRQQRSLSIEQVSDLLASIDTSRPIGRRNLALVSLMIDTGFRASEICRLKDAAVDLKLRMARVPVKGGKDGLGVFSEETAVYCAAWRADRATVARCPEFFVGFELHRPGYRLSREGLTDIIRSIGKNAGLRLSPHDLRRTFATLSILMGAPSRLVQVAGRWSDLKLVERYTQTITAKAIDPYSPIAAAVRRVER